jgi:hypothetical protein
MAVRRDFFRPIRGWLLLLDWTPGLRPGLHSLAASRLGWRRPRSLKSTAKVRGIKGRVLESQLCEVLGAQPEAIEVEGGEA